MLWLQENRQGTVAAYVRLFHYGMNDTPFRSA
jgi:hypothetical protein